MYSIVVIGGGLSGLLCLKQLIENGWNENDILLVEQGSSIGGAWYWNQYPGSRCDASSYEYCYHDDEQLFKEWSWNERLASQKDILAYLLHVAKRSGLEKMIRLNTRVAAMHWSSETNTWNVAIEQNDQKSNITASVCIAATGPLSKPFYPNIIGLNECKSRVVHTGVWPSDLSASSFAGKRVAVIGTGSSGVQVITNLAPICSTLTVFQRSPNFVFPAGNCPLSFETEAFYKSNRASLIQQVRASEGAEFAKTAYDSLSEVSEEKACELLESAWTVSGAELLNLFGDLFSNRQANEFVANWFRRKVASLIHSPNVARLLLPSSSAVIGLKRSQFGHNYYDVFNRDNVELISVKEEPIKQLTQTGIRTDEREMEFDYIIMATGFDALTGAIDDLNILGENDKRLSSKWANRPINYLGLCTSGFPNMLFVLGPSSPISSTISPVIEYQVEWLIKLLKHARARGWQAFDIRESAEKKWMEIMTRNAEAHALMTSNCSSWYNGANVPGKPQHYSVFLGFAQYIRHCEQAIQEEWKCFKSQ